ncbi:hypothetical protein Leryth_000809 [Lithospermum erythrorhizon]|nr:hypothetical protein Leryth_000809 [Lithospermum erythrorhizon]
MLNLYKSLPKSSKSQTPELIPPQMQNLSLKPPKLGQNHDKTLINESKSCLIELESLIWSLLTSSGSRAELRLWLCNSIAGIGSISPRKRRDLFMNLLELKQLKRRHVAAQLLKLMFHKVPKKVGGILAERSYLLEEFFRGNPWRITQWFSNFAGTGNLDHRKGAKALSQFAFVNRDICWEELEWKGKRGQSPAMVATKPHYFLDLDVLKTVENFLEYVPEFWSSSQFADSLRDGEILAIDSDFFVQLFVDLMYKEDVKDVWEVVNEFLMVEPFATLCRHLLIILEEQEFPVFLDLICKYLGPKVESLEHGNVSHWLEIVLIKCSRSGLFFNDLLLLNAVTSQPRQLLRIIQEEGAQEEKDMIKRAISRASESTSSTGSIGPLLEECFCRKTLESVKWLGVQSWAVYYRLSEEFGTSQLWESLFINNGITFRKTDKYSLLEDHDRFSVDSGSESDERISSKVKRKKKERRRKRKRKDFHAEFGSDNELAQIDFISDKMVSQSGGGDWLLSTDGFSATWNSVRPR